MRKAGNLPYDPVKEFSGVAHIGYSTTVLVVSPQTGVKSVKELIALANAQPGKILFGSAGAGSAFDKILRADIAAFRQVGKAAGLIAK
jgi:tripartite-type tricarboxylate transporter receptor subunit TctC